MGLYVDTLQSASPDSFTLNIIAAMGVAAAPKMPKIHVYHFCQEWAKTDKDLASLCLQIGKTMENNGKNFWTTFIGNVIQQNIYQVEKNMDAAKKTALRRQVLVFDNKNEQHEKAFNLRLYDKDLYSSWLNNLRELGEVAATNMLTEEAILLSKNAFYAPCPKPE